MMLNLARVIKPWKEADALSAHINLYGFWTETTFLTKSGDLGMVLSVAGVDYESLDNDEQQYAVKRLILKTTGSNSALSAAPGSVTCISDSTNRNARPARPTRSRTSTAVKQQQV